MDYLNNYNYQANSFIGNYVSTYDEVINTPAPINGTAIIFADLNNMMLYSKKNVNGVPTVQPYKLTPIYQEAIKPQEKPVESDLSNDMIKSLMDQLNALRNDISALKKENVNESK